MIRSPLPWQIIAFITAMCAAAHPALSKNLFFLVKTQNHDLIYNAKDRSWHRETQGHKFGILQCLPKQGTQKSTRTVQRQ